MDNSKSPTRFSVFNKARVAKLFTSTMVLTDGRMTCYYNTAIWYYFLINGDNDGRSKYLQIFSCDHFKMIYELQKPLDVTDTQKVYLKVQFNRAIIQFYNGLKPDSSHKLGPVLEGSILSDDHIREGSNRYRLAVHHTFIGICSQDLTGLKINADFDWFEYREM